MNKIGIVLIMGLCFTSGIIVQDKLVNQTPPQSRDLSTCTKVYFSPKGGCTEAAVEAITATSKTILIQAYSFTSDPIAQALIAANKRGVEIHVILDRSQLIAKGSVIDSLHTAGIDIRVDEKHQIAHNKVMVLDGARVITGSFNFTRQAEISNAENMLVIDSLELAGLYTQHWHEHYDHSIVFSGK